MEDKDIIKALECCMQDGYACRECCFDEENECIGALSRNALDLINRQKEEKEALINGQETLQKYIAEARAEAITEFAERLKEKVEYIPWCEYRPVQNAIDDLAKEMKEGVNNA